MTAVDTPPAITPSRPAAPPSRRYINGEDWLASLGGVPLRRVIFDPWPGTATEADLLKLVEGSSKRLCELVNGTLLEKPVSLHEAHVAAILITDLTMWSRAHANRFLVSGADSTLRMATLDRIRLPDVCVFARSRLPGGKLPREKVPSLSPDLAVEVLSESNTPAEMRQKLREYFANGTRLAWYVNPQSRTVAIYTSDADEPAKTVREGETLTGGDVLPGFELAVATLFADLPSDAE